MKKASNYPYVGIMPKKTMTIETKVIPDDSLFGDEDATPKAALPKKGKTDKLESKVATKVESKVPAEKDSDSDDSDDEPAKPAVKASAKAPAEKAPAEKAPAEKAPAEKKTAKTASKDESDDSDDETEKKPASKAAKKTASKDESDDSDDETEKKPATKTAKKTASKKSKSDSDTEIDEELTKSKSNSDSETSSKKGGRKKAVPTDAVMNFVEELLKENTDGHGAVNVKAITKVLRSDETKEQLTTVLQKAAPAARKKKERDPDAPKRPLNAYMYFCKDHRDEVKKEFPELKGPAITAKLGEMWKALSPKKKKKYEEQNEADKKRYETQMKEYDPDSFKPEKPKKAKTSFLCFSVDMRADVKAKNPDMSGKEITAELGRMWRDDYSHSDEAKQNKLRIKWIKMAEDDKARYEAEMKKWLEDHPEEAEELRKKEEAKKNKGKKGKKGSSKSDEEKEEEKEEKEDAAEDTEDVEEDEETSKKSKKSKSKKASDDDEEDEEEEGEKKAEKKKGKSRKDSSDTGMAKFLTTRRAEMAKSHPTMGPAQIASKLKAEWEKMSADERAEWEDE